jgi:hypothetical protein
MAAVGVTAAAAVAANAATPAATATAPAPAHTSTSALSQSLDKSAQQSAAMKNWDARDAKSNGSTTASNQSNGNNGNNANSGYSGSTYPSTPSYTPSYRQQPSTVIVHNNDSGMSNMMWFMMGRSWGHGDRTVYVNNGQPQTYSNGVPMSGNTGVAMAEPPEPSSHWFLRLLMWAMVLGVIGYAIHLFIQMRKKSNPTPKQNYTL